MTMPTNIQIFECRDDGTFGPMLRDYFQAGNGAIYATLIKNTWYFFNAAEAADNPWHKPGPMGVRFCENALMTRKMVRVSEERFEAESGIWYLDSVRELLGGPADPWRELDA